jgi:hypothetical protein
MPRARLQGCGSLPRDGVGQNCCGKHPKRKTRELPRGLSESRIGQLSEATFLETPSYERWCVFVLLDIDKVGVLLDSLKAQRASCAFAECPLVVTFFNCLLGVGWDDY